MSYEFLMDDCENCICSQVREGVFSVESFSDIPAYVLSRLNLTAEKSSCSGNGTESCPNSQSGTTSELSTVGHGGEKSMLYVEDSRARTLAMPEKEQESMASAADSGAKWPESSVKLDRASRSWKIHRHSLFGDWVSSFETWPKWGMMLGGECFPLPMLEHCTYEKGYGYWPTPTKSDHHGASMATVEGRMNTLKNFLHFHFADKTHRTTCPNPDVSERLMQWPIGWTELSPLGMDKFQEWLSSHGKP